MRHPFGDTVTVIRSTPGGTDQYGDPKTSTIERIPIQGCAVAPRFSSDMTDRGRDGVVIGKTVYPPAGADIRATDRLELEGDLYEIDGEPIEWRNPISGDAPGGEIALRRARG